MGTSSQCFAEGFGRRCDTPEIVSSLPRAALGSLPRKSGGRLLRVSDAHHHTSSVRGELHAGVRTVYHESVGRIVFLTLRHVVRIDSLVGWPGHSRHKERCDSRIRTHYPAARDLISRGLGLVYFLSWLAWLPKEAFDSHCLDVGA